VPERIEPGPGQESVWDYPRPPRVERSDDHVRVELDGALVAETHRSFRVLETSQPPAFYVPVDDVDLDRFLRVPDHHTFCEWKGHATYWSVRGEDRVVERAAWSYPDPTPAFVAIRDHFAFYPRLLDCFLDDEPVQTNDGDFYGGWITSKVVGPFKGAPGTGHW
jgi:uncharacterized protein (DUF427 family)